MVIEKQGYSLDDLLAMGEDARVEIIGGELIEMSAAGFRHQIIANNINFILQPYVRQHDIGIVLPDGMTYLMNSPTKTLEDSFVPDVSLLLKENVSADWDIDKPHPSVPDLAIEIISPSDDPDRVQRKRRTYLEKGTQQVWLVYPKTQEVHQYTSAEPNTSRIYKDEQSMDADTLFPKIESLTLPAIFKLPKWALKDD